MGIFYEQGQYRGEIMQTALGKSENKGTPQFVVKVKVQAKYVGDGEVDVKESERTVYLSMTEKSMPYVVKKLKAAGYEGSTTRELIAHDFTGRPVELNCTHEAGQSGGDREKWDLAWGETEVKPLDDKDMSTLDALFAGKPAPKRTRSLEITGDEVPY